MTDYFSSEEDLSSTPLPTTEMRSIEGSDVLQIPGSSTPTDDDAEATSTGHTSCNRIQPREEQDPPPETHSYDSTHRPRSQSSRSKPFRPLPRSISPVNVFVTPSCHCSRSRLHTPLHIPCGCSKRTPSMRSPFGSSRFTPSPGPSGTTPFSPASGRRQAPTRASPSPPLRSQWDQGIKQGLRVRPRSSRMQKRPQQLA